MGQIVKACICRVGGGLGVTDRERRERGRVDAMNRKHPEWIPRDGHAWLGRTGLDPGGGGWGWGWGGGVERLLHVQLDRERERQKDDRERPPGADRCSPALQLRPHSWPGSGDISLYVSLSLSPHQNTCFNAEGSPTTSYGMLHYVRYSSFNMASLSTRLHHSHNSSDNCLELKTSTLCYTLERSPIMHPSCIFLQITIIAYWNAAEP